MPASDPVVIVSAARTPLGRLQGDFLSLSGNKRGSHVIAAGVQRAKLTPDRIDEALMGCMLPAGQGQAPARQAARGDYRVGHARIIGHMLMDCREEADEVGHPICGTGARLIGTHLHALEAHG